MCDSDEFEFMEDDFWRSNERRKLKLERLSLRVSAAPFQMPDNMFVKRYRLSKEQVHELCSELQSFMPQPTKSTDLSIEVKILTALSFYATGSYQRPIGDIAAHSIAQQTVSAVVSQVTQCLNLQHFRRKYIKFPNTLEERRANIVGFYNKFGMPGVIGCIDGTHVAIIRPREHEERFCCRKQYHSLNVQVICNSDMEIISVDASNGGASHDSFMWANHPIKAYMEELNDNVWLLGDSGYPLRRYMMTPVVNAPPNSPEAHYTGIHVRTRSIVERAIGQLKARFRCLLVHRVLHYEPIVAGSIVNACVILHNICNRRGTPVPELTAEEALQEAELQFGFTLDSTSERSNQRNGELNEGVLARRAIINHLWVNRPN